MLSYSSAKAPLRVGIVDDSPLIRQMIEKVVEEADDMEVAGKAADPYEAREMIKRVSPDVITLDVEMPRMDGIEFLDKIMTLRPMPVIMVSTLTQRAADITLKALQIGAVDYVGKPVSKDSNSGTLLDVFRKDLVPKLHLIRSVNKDSLRVHNTQSTDSAPVNLAQKNKYKIIGIGSSTGGVERLRYLISSLRMNVPPMLIVQHMNKNYVQNMAERMNDIAPDHVRVKCAEHMEPLQDNTIYFADNHSHMCVNTNHSGRYIELQQGAAENGFIASIDWLFRSMVQCASPRMLGIILSGLGKDGAAGALGLRQKGALMVGESEQSCLVYGMSKAASNMGALCKELSVQGISKVINNQEDVV